MKRILAITSVVAAMSLAGCATYREQRVATGAALGGAGGAIIGGVASNSVGGALAGGVIGAAAGAIVADATRPRYYRHYRRCHWSSYYGRRICR